MVIFRVLFLTCDQKSQIIQRYRIASLFLDKKNDVLELTHFLSSYYPVLVYVLITISCYQCSPSPGSFVYCYQ